MGNEENNKQNLSVINIDPKGEHEMGREVGVDYRGLMRLKERLTKAKPRKRDRMC